MATASETIAIERSGGFTAFADRWIYVFMAALFIVAVLAGFIPDSNRMLTEVAAGERPPLPLVLHVHAVLRGSWLLLLLAQAILMATGRRRLHMQLGLIAMVLAPAMVITGFVLIPVMVGQFADGIRHGPPEAAAQMRDFLPFITNILLAQLRAGFVFSVLVAIALAVRRSDSQLHKRLMFLATATPMAAATDRIPFLPHSIPGSPLTVDLWPLVLIAPMILYDLYRQRRIHRAYWIWLGVAIVPATLMHTLWGTPWWFKTALSLLGASDLAQ
jgi:hypothetical protein